MTLREIMTRDVHVVGPELDADRAWRCMQQVGVRHLAVVEDGRVIGLISERDLGGRHGEPVRAGRRVRDLMTPDPIARSPDADVREVAELLRSLGIDCVPVVSGAELLGMVTTHDLLGLVARGAAPAAPV